MLQPHQLIAEFEAAISEEERQKLKDGVLEGVLRAAQVTSRSRCIFYPPIVYINSFNFIINPIQEAIVIPPLVALAIRPRPGVWEYVRVNVNELAIEELSVPEYLQFKEQLVDEG